MSNNCIASYLDGRKRRLKDPLQSGVYKIRDTETPLLQIRGSLAGIQKKIELNEPFLDGQHLGDCLAEERADWMERLPNYISDVLGHKVIPAIWAFAGDGLPQDLTMKVASLAEQEVNVLLAKSEMLRVLIHESNDGSSDSADGYVLDIIELFDETHDFISRYNPRARRKP